MISYDSRGFSIYGSNKLKQQSRYFFKESIQTLYLYQIRAASLVEPRLDLRHAPDARGPEPGVRR